MADEIFLLDASINGIPLQIENTKDTFQVALHKHEFPFKDGAKLENMGQKARVILVKCHFFEETYDDHKRLLTLLNERSLFDFIHPKYGLMKGGIEQVVVDHGDTDDAQIDFTFVEQLRGSNTYVNSYDLEDSAEQDFITIINEAMISFEADVVEALGEEAPGLLELILDAGSDLLEQANGITGKGREYVSLVAGYVRQFQSVMNEVKQPANSLISTLNYANSLPGVLMKTVADTAGRILEAYTSLRTAPQTFVHNVNSQFALLLSSLEEKRTVYEYKSHHPGKATSKAAAVVMAGALNLELAYILKADERNHTSTKAVANMANFGITGKFIKSPPQPTLLSMDEINKALHSSREFVAQACQDNQGATILKRSAATLLDYVNGQRGNLEKVKEVELTNPIPIHLLCLMNGLPYQYAERLLAINKISQPCFITGKVKVYVR